MNNEEIETLKDNLSLFRGSDQWFKVYPNVILTEGVKYLADTAECYWLVDIVYSCQFDPKVKKEQFQSYELTVDLASGKADLLLHDGNYNTLYEQHIPLCTFPLPKLTLFYSNNVLLLPSEW